MRNILAGAVLGLLVSATFGCGGSSSSDGGAVAENSGQPVAATPGSASGIAPVGDSGPPGGMPGGMSSGPPGGMPGGMSGGPPGGMSGGPPGGMPAGMSTSRGEETGSAAGEIASGEVASGEVSSGEGAGVSAAADGIGGASAAGPGGASYPGAATAGPGGASYPGAATAGPGGASYPGAAGTRPGGAGYPPGGPAGISGGFPGGRNGTSGEETSGVGTSGDGTPGGGGSAAPTTFDGLAKQAFQQGKEREAIQYLQAWALTSDAGASEVLSGIQWVSALRRPTMAVRWGLGIQLVAPKGFTGDAKPIGSQQTFGGTRTGRPGGSGDGKSSAPGLPGGGSSGFGGEGGSGGEGGGGGNDAIGQYAGEFGTMILDQFQSRISSGKFGRALKDAPSGTSGAEGAGGGGGFPGDGGLASSGPASGTLGPPGLKSSGGSGRPMGMRGGARGGASSGDSAAGFGGSATNAAGGQSATGLTLLGVGADSALKEKALQARVDVLAIFRVKVSVNRAEFIVNDSEIVLLDPVKGKELFRSGTLNNIKVQKARELSKDDGVEKEVKKLFEFIDKDLTVTDMPSALTPEIVKMNRVEKQLLVGSIDDPLAVLTEIRFYQRNKLLADADAAAAIAKVAGGDANAKTLLEGKEEERKKVIEKWLPKG